MGALFLLPQLCLSELSKKAVFYCPRGSHSAKKLFLIVMGHRFCVIRENCFLAD